MLSRYSFDRQEIFDRVATHLLTQGEKSVRGGVYCAYRGPKGRKCAIGALISDEAYSRDLEGNAVRDGRDGDLVELALCLSGIDVRTDDDVDFLQALQSIHDGQSPRVWLYELREFARAHDLSSRALEPFAVAA